jgi:hypothetical protein
MKARRHSLMRYLPASCDLFTYFEITRGQTRRGFENLPCLLARVWSNGNFELLSPAWDVLGYTDEELIGRRICELLALEPRASRAAIASLLSEGGAVAFGLWCKDGYEVNYHWNRHFDDFTTSMFIIGDVIRPTRSRVPGPAPQRARALPFHAR